MDPSIQIWLLNVPLVPRPERTILPEDVIPVAPEIVPAFVIPPVLLLIPPVIFAPLALTVRPPEDTVRSPEIVCAVVNLLF